MTQYLTGYSYERCIGIASEHYALICTNCGNEYDLNNITRFNCKFIQHPITGAFALEFQEEVISYLIEKFQNELVNFETLNNDGWFH